MLHYLQSSLAHPTDDGLDQISLMLVVLIL